MEIRSIQENELDDWFSFVTKAFGHKKNPPSRSYFERHFWSDPWRNIDGIFVAVEDGEIVGTVRNFNRELYCQRKKVKVCGIGEVCTHENYRGRGIATKLLEHSISYMTESKFALSLLHTGTASKLYESLGWVAVGREYRSRRIRSPLYSTLPIDLTVEVCSGEIFEGQWLESLRDIYNNCSINYNGPVVRQDIQYWKQWVNEETGTTAWRISELTPKRFKVLFKNIPVGFVVLQFCDSNVRVREWSLLDDLLPPGIDYFNAILSYICRIYGVTLFLFPRQFPLLKRMTLYLLITRQCIRTFVSNSYQ
eukprot:jgi/Galph1/954/GphlegSOOS_G5704.1